MEPDYPDDCIVARLGCARVHCGRAQNGKGPDLRPNVFTLASAIKSLGLTLYGSSILNRISRRLCGITPHLCGQVKVRMCLARLQDCENASPHVSRTYGLSPLCARMCAARLLVTP